MNTSWRRRPHSYAAFAREEVADAERGFPIVDLAAYAAARGLRRRNGNVLGAFVGSLPTWPDYVFDVVDGPLPDGRYGLVEHDLFEIDTDSRGIRASGAFYGVKTRVFDPLFPNIAFFADEVRSEPFAGNGVWLPSTRVAVRVPECMLMPHLVVGPQDRMSGSLRVDAAGRIFAVADNPAIDAATGEAMVRAIGPALKQLSDPFVRLELRLGVLTISVNGYRADMNDLDRLVWAACSASAGLVEIAPRFVQVGAAPADQWSPLVDDAARQLGLTRYAGADFHRALVRSPIPGCAVGALFGQIQGDRAPTWTTWHTHGGHTAATVRGGAAMQCSSPASMLPLGGHLEEESDMYVEIVDDVAYAWTRSRLAGTLDHANVVTRARHAWTRVGVQPA
jgi:hypothetical protein